MSSTTKLSGLYSPLNEMQIRISVSTTKGEQLRHGKWKTLGRTIEVRFNLSAVLLNFTRTQP